MKVFSLTYLAVGAEEGSERVITTWHNVTVGPAWFRKYVMDYVTRGSRVIVDGSLAYYKSTLPDGSVRVSTSVKASEFDFYIATHRRKFSPFIFRGADNFIYSKTR